VTADLAGEIAFTLEAEPKLLPFLPQLLQDLPTLGGALEDVLDLLRRGGLPAGSSVLDLGCGRGEIAIAIARELAASVTGVDAFAPFIERARALAGAAGLGGRCTFRCEDLRCALREPATYDAVLMVALGPVLGDLNATVGALRRVVRPGGLILIDDAVLAAGHEAPPGWEGYLARAEAERALTARGDRLLAVVERTAAMSAYNRHALTAIARRAHELARASPALAPALERYLVRQQRETHLMEGPIVPAMWLLRRGGPDPS
jgi:SAM-dependent methyltransferase